jgi:hypothetical protein
MRSVPLAGWKRCLAAVVVGLLVYNAMRPLTVRKPVYVGIYSACQWLGLLSETVEFEECGASCGDSVNIFPPTTGTVLLGAAIYLGLWPSIALLPALLVYHRLTLYDRSQPRCSRCGYLLIKLTAPRCPECGKAI